MRWNACVLRLDLGLYSHPKEFLGNGFRTHVNFKGKILSTRKKSPLRRMGPMMLDQAGQWAQHTTNKFFRPCRLDEMPHCPPGLDSRADTSAWQHCLCLRKSLIVWGTPYSLSWLLMCSPLVAESRSKKFQTRWMLTLPRSSTFMQLILLFKQVKLSGYPGHYFGLIKQKRFSCCRLCLWR